MGYLTNSIDTIRVHLNEHYWVDIKTSLTLREVDKVRELETLVEFKDTTSKNPTATTPNIQRAAFERVVLSIFDWNIDDENGNVIPCNPSSIRNALARFPERDYEKLVNATKGFETKEVVSQKEAEEFQVDNEGDS